MGCNTLRFTSEPQRVCTQVFASVLVGEERLKIIWPYPGSMFLASSAHLLKIQLPLKNKMQAKVLYLPGIAEVFNMLNCFILTGQRYTFFIFQDQFPPWVALLTRISSFLMPKCKKENLNVKEDMVQWQSRCFAGSKSQVQYPSLTLENSYSQPRLPSRASKFMPGCPPVATSFPSTATFLHLSSSVLLQRWPLPLLH